MTRPLQRMKISNTMCNKKYLSVHRNEIPSIGCLTTSGFESRRTALSRRIRVGSIPCLGSKSARKGNISLWKELRSSLSRPLAPASRRDPNLPVCTGFKKSGPLSAVRAQMLYVYYFRIWLPRLFQRATSPLQISAPVVLCMKLPAAAL